MKRVAIVASAALIPAVALAQAPDARVLAEKLASREFVQSISLAPSGNQAVIVSPRDDGGETAVVIDFATASSTPILSSEGGREHLSSCQFAVEDRVVCRIVLSDGSNRDVVSASRLVSVPTDGSEMQLLTARTSSDAYYESGFGGGLIGYNVDGEPNSVLLTRFQSPEKRTGNLTGRSAEGLAVEKVDLRTLDRRIVEQPKKTALRYLADGEGNVRMMVTQAANSSGYGKQAIEYSYRPLEGGNWRNLSTVELEGGLAYGFQPVAVDSGANVAYGFENHNGYSALYSVSLDGSKERKLLLAREGSDIDSLIRIGKSRRVVGASYATEKRTIEYFDAELATLAKQLGAALGNDMAVSIVDSSDDESKLLVFAGSDTKPGSFYLFDKASKKLGLLLPIRPALNGLSFGEMRPVTYPSRDGVQIPGYLTLPPGSDGKNLPAIVMPHGGPWARDEWGFDWLVQYYASRGFAVLQPNFRGSTGYGSEWFKKNGFQSWETAIGDVNDAGRWLQQSGIAAPGKLAIVGWSYGGYAALQSAVLDPDLFKAIVAIAPVTDLEALREESRDDYNFRIMESAIGSGPHIEAGSPARHADMFKAPVLLVHGDADTNVRVSESRLMERRLKSAGKQVDYIEFEDLDHYLSEPEARARLLLESEATIRKGLGL